MSAIQELLHDKHASVDTALVMELLRSHPTCVVPAAMLLAQHGAALSQHERETLQRAVALGCADPVAMADLADLSGSDWANLYPRVEAAPGHTTTETIDKFLNTYGKPNPREDELLERLIFNPVAPDYFPGLDRPMDPSDPLALPPELAEPQPTQDDESAPPPIPDYQIEGPDNEAGSEVGTEFAEQAQEASLPTAGGDGQDDKPREEPLLMESLAKIFIKQRRYERAYEIIANLSLKNPEKSAYFADQLRFLQKLILNQRFKDRET